MSSISFSSWNASLSGLKCCSHARVEKCDYPSLYKSEVTFKQPSLETEANMTFSSELWSGIKDQTIFSLAWAWCVITWYLECNLLSVFNTLSNRQTSPNSFPLTKERLS